MIIEWILCGKLNLQAWIKVYGFNPEFLKYPAFAYSAMLPLTLPSEVMFWLNWLDESPILFWINIKSISYPVLHQKLILQFVRMFIRHATGGDSTDNGGSKRDIYMSTVRHVVLPK